MKPLLLVVVYLSVALDVSAQTPMTPRPIDPLAAETFEQAMAGSPLVRDLVRRLEASNLVVHIESSRSLPLGVSGILRWVTSRGGYRYVRVSLAADLRPAARAAILGHELQHACEVAASDANDVDGLRRVYLATGTRTTLAGNTFETPAAIQVEKQVRAELRADHSRSTSSRREAPSRQAVPSRQEVPSRRDH